MFKLLILTFLITASSLFGTSEYMLKTAYLYNITKFVQWSDERFESENADIKIGIYGKDFFKQYIDTLKNKKIAKHPIKITRVEKLIDIDKFDILFISKSEKNKMNLISKTLANSAVLTISDMDDFIDRGGMIHLKTVKNRLKIVINIALAKKNNIKFSAKLLEIASIIELESGL